MKGIPYGIDLPHVSAELVAALKKKYPDKCPDIIDPDRLIWFRAGQRSVAAYLEDQQRRQQEAGRACNAESLFLETGTKGGA